VKKLKIGSFPARSVRRSARSTRWNARSARVFGCGFKTVICQTHPIQFFHSSRVARSAGVGSFTPQPVPRASRLSPSYERNVPSSSSQFAARDRGDCGLQPLNPSEVPPCPRGTLFSSNATARHERLPWQVISLSADPRPFQTQEWSREVRAEWVWLFSLRDRSRPAQLTHQR
jgi:hypothetical protein